MKRLFLLTICAVLFLGSQFLINCSSPLESDGGGVPTPPRPNDTIYVYDTTFDTTFDTVFVSDSASDTIFVHDTVTVSDTVVDSFYVIDTLEITDTLIYYDTVFVGDSCEPGPMCAEFNKYNKKVYWKLHNERDKYKLEFTANFNEGCFDNILHIHIYGKKYEWNPKVNPTFTITKELLKNAKVMIHCKKKKDDDKDGRYDDCDDDDDDGKDKDKDCCNVEVCFKATKL